MATSPYSARALAPLLLAATLAACGTGPRFRDAPVVWKVDDTRTIATPEARDYNAYAYFADVLVFDQATDLLALSDRELAHDINALEEVPDSTWFQNRIGVRPMAPDEAATGPAHNGPPQLPITVTGGKSGGGNPGFVVKDARDITFLIKFDEPIHPEHQTTASVVVNRILWAAGYNVPSDMVFVFGPGDITVADDATVSDPLDNDHPLTRAYIDGVLAGVAVRPDGRWRASASEFLGGTPMGGFPRSGTRDDDPNDHVDHEHRRSLRALRVLAAWVDHTDIKEDNTLDMLVAEDGRQFLRHYFVDFGEALGAHRAEKHRPDDGWKYVFDWGEVLTGVATLGVVKRPWEDLRPTGWLALGDFATVPLVPDEWKEAYPYAPFRELDASDAFWGAKLVMRFDRWLLEAIVAEAKLTDPNAAAYLVDALLRRREAIGRAWLEGLSALDDFHVDTGGAQLCMVDLGVRYGLAADGLVEVLNAKDQALSSHPSAPSTGEVCVPRPDDAYAKLRLRVRRGVEAKPPLEVHVVEDITDKRAGRVVGVIRDAR